MNVLVKTTVLVCALAFTNIGFAQPRVSPRSMYERLIAVVPIVGSGARSDPKRPMFAPAPGQISPASRTAIIAYAWAPTDDGQHAIVEFVARNRSGFSQILADRSVQTFVKGNAKRADLETALKVHKKDFDFNTFGVYAR